MRNPEHAAVIKFGGSAATTLEGANREYFLPLLSRLSPLLQKHFCQAVFVIGGGPRARQEQSKYDTDREKDAAGMRVLREHAAQLTDFSRQSGLTVASSVPHNETEASALIHDTDAFVTTLGGLKTGQSTDTVAVTAAEFLAEKNYVVSVAILSNVWRIFTADPKIDPGARPICEADLAALLRLGVLWNDPQRFVPGMSITIDPVAVSRLQHTKTYPRLWFGHAQDTSSLTAFLQGKQPENGTSIPQKTSGVTYHE